MNSPDGHPRHEWAVLRLRQKNILCIFEIVFQPIEHISKYPRKKLTRLLLRLFHKVYFVSIGLFVSSIYISHQNQFIADRDTPATKFNEPPMAAPKRKRDGSLGAICFHGFQGTSFSVW